MTITASVMNHRDGRANYDRHVGLMRAPTDVDIFTVQKVAFIKPFKAGKSCS